MGTRYATALTVLGTVILGAFIWMRPLVYIPDDSYFYLTIAHNIVNGYGSTFNQMTPTNGYHPLWMIFCVLAFLIVGSSKSAAISAVIIIQGALFVGMVALFRKACVKSGLRFPIAGVPVLSVYFLSLGLIGSEAFLNGFAILLASFFLVDVLERPDDSSSWVKLGVTSGLFCLARLDNVFLAGGFLVFGLLSALERTGKRESAPWYAIRALWFAVPFLVVVSPYLVHNYLAYGHIVPISGAVKSSFPVAAPRLSNLGLLGFITGCVGVASLALSLRASKYPVAKFLLRAFGLGVVVQIVYIFVFTRYVVGSAMTWPCPWYWVAGVVNGCFLICFLFQRARRSSWIAGTAKFLLPGVTAVLFFIAIAKVAGVLQAHPGLPPLTLAEDFQRASQVQRMVSARISSARWMYSNLPFNSVVLVPDIPGVLAYYSDLKILAMDGLTTDYEFADDARKMGIEHLVRRYNVNYYAGPMEPGSAGAHTVAFFDPLYHEPIGAIQLQGTNLMKVLPALGWGANWGVWKIGP